jgi:hypothetical protein
VATVGTDDGEQTLAWEARNRTRAGIAGILAGLLTLGGGVAASLVYADFPTVGLLPALREATAPGSPPRESLKAAQVLFYSDHAAVLILVSIVLALGALLVAVPLLYLFQAAKARRPETPTIGRVAVVAGPVLIAVSTLVQQVAACVQASSFATQSDHSSQAARDVLHGGFIVAPAILKELGVIVLALAFILVGINAMRAGLLTRFMGILGMLVGVLFVLPVGSSLPIVQAFWLIAVGALILGRWPTGMPPAWVTGRAEPWPSQQQLREQRDAARAGKESPPSRASARPVPDDRDEDDTAVAGLPSPHPRSKKKKRRH